MSNILTFGFEKTQIRTVEQGGAIWFVAADVCRALSITNPSQAMERLDEDERAMFNIGRQGEAHTVNESGLYNLIFGSRKETARRFRKWVTGTVLPTLRKQAPTPCRPLNRLIWPSRRSRKTG